MAVAYVIRIYYKNGHSEFYQGWTYETGNLFCQNINLAFACETYEQAKLTLEDITNTGVYQIEKVFLQE